MDPVIPLFRADWQRPVFMHFCVSVGRLQPSVPYELDTFEGDAFVSLVAFTQANLRPAGGGRLGRFLSQPLATHEFLNLRTYVRHRGERGIYFIAEWIPNRLAVLIGPRMYGLPYRLGSLEYHCNESTGVVGGIVRASIGSLAYRGNFDPVQKFELTRPSTLDHFLIERYAAFTMHGTIGRCFRIAHDPWLAVGARIELTDRFLLDSVAPLKGLPLTTAHFSPGVRDVAIGWPIKQTSMGASGTL